MKLCFVLLYLKILVVFFFSFEDASTLPTSPHPFPPPFILTLPSFVLTVPTASRLFHHHTHASTSQHLLNPLFTTFPAPILSIVPCYPFLLLPYNNPTHQGWPMQMPHQSPPSTLIQSSLLRMSQIQISNTRILEMRVFWLSKRKITWLQCMMLCRLNGFTIITEVRAIWDYAFWNGLN